ncbi:hypothetical protein BP6252_05756 [Coleophoma cylindrospora]|uniref:Serine aminopeptidase S33 domain-containing protein n=1 Tax=Coleophoma cylindrospora TaxID=1849047 RepID=A0A3D8RUI4_9HELO|nr:hypothetical protein BP6252_05756 [Coleophoma cylindrospora]
MRNHGDREVSSSCPSSCAADTRKTSPDANRTWKNGNEAHGIDLMSLIDGSALDFKLVMTYLPAYLPQFHTFHNIMGGVSLGGHVAWRMPALIADKVEAAIMVVGCPNLTALMLNRLRIDPTILKTTAEDLYKIPYETLAGTMTVEQKTRWPQVLSRLVSEQDAAIDEKFPNIPLLLMGGKQDPLVPVRFTEPWVKKHIERNVEFFVQDNTGHSCTKEMVARMAAWLGDLYSK